MENLNNWLPDNDVVISVDEANKYGKDGTITVQCGSLKYTFGVKHIVDINKNMKLQLALQFSDMTVATVNLLLFLHASIAITKNS